MLSILRLMVEQTGPCRWLSWVHKQGWWLVWAHSGFGRCFVRCLLSFQPLGWWCSPWLQLAAGARACSQGPGRVVRTACTSTTRWSQTHFDPAQLGCLLSWKPAPLHTLLCYRTELWPVCSETKQAEVKTLKMQRHRHYLEWIEEKRRGAFCYWLHFMFIM